MNGPPANDRRRMRELRMEMLRMRAEVERAEVASAMRELRGGARRLRTFAGVAGSLGAALRGRRDWPALIAGAVSGRPWLAAAALGAVRALKKRPMLLAAAIGAVALGAWVRGARRPRAASDLADG
jgi:hypothetical protein